MEQQSKTNIGFDSKRKLFRFKKRSVYSSLSLTSAFARLHVLTNRLTQTTD